MNRIHNRNTTEEIHRLAKATSVMRICLMAFLASFALAQTGGPYNLEWNTIDGGGGRSVGGQYVLTGTIGQPDAGSMSGGSYELLGGFWPAGPLCFVDFKDFARFAELWLYEGEGLPADLDGNDYVDLYDLKIFVDYWLLCCPYNWPLR